MASRRPAARTERAGSRRRRGGSRRRWPAGRWRARRTWRRRRSSRSGNLVIGGFGTGEVNNCGPTRFGGGILFVDGMLYGASQNDVYAIDARDGSVLWHYYWKYRGGTTTGTRGPSMWHNYIYFELHDDWVVCLDARTGREVWKKEIAPFEQQYFSSNAPMVIGNHIIVGTGNDTDEPAFLKSLDPETGERAVAAVLDGAEGRRSRARKPGPVSMRRVMAAARRGFPVLTIRRRTCICSVPAIRRRPIRRDAATATIFILRACSR